MLAHIQKCMRAIHHMKAHYNNDGAVPLFDSHSANRDPNTPYNTAYWFSFSSMWENDAEIEGKHIFVLCTGVRHVTGTGSGLLGGILRVVVQMSALT